MTLQESFVQEIEGKIDIAKWIIKLLSEPKNSRFSVIKVLEFYCKEQKKRRDDWIRELPKDQVFFTNLYCDEIDELTNATPGL